ncbi:MAG: protein kinase [Oscillospiraceae bacterium]
MENNYIGRRLDERYEIVSLIGVGGMSNVYKAIDLQSSTVVAIKVLKQEFFDNDELVRRFKNESKAISLLNNPNIIKVLDVNITEKEKYIVVEYIDGITLKEYIENRKVLTWQETIQFTGTILSAIGHAHENGIIHRDLKPQNVMLLRDGTLKIMDFGIARLSTANQKTVTDKAIGSVHYISPEQVRGKNTDSRSDIYSIGIMMYEMLTGTLPFKSETAVSVAMQQLSDIAVRPTQIVPSIPQGLEQIVIKAISKDADKRYQTASEMLRDLNEFKTNPAIIFDYADENEKTQAVTVDKVASKKPTKKVKVKRGFRLTLPVLAGVAAAFALSAVVAIIMIFSFSGNPLFSNQQEVELPSFVGMTEQQVKDAGYKFKYNIEYVYSADYEEGTVFSQAPKPPKTVKEKGTVKLKVSKGAQTSQLPDLANYTRSEAEKSSLIWA